jgi:hypothetical protein
LRSGGRMVGGSGMAEPWVLDRWNAEVRLHCPSTGLQETIYHNTIIHLAPVKLRPIHYLPNTFDPGEKHKNTQEHSASPEAQEAKNLQHKNTQERSMIGDVGVARRWVPRMRVQRVVQQGVVERPTGVPHPPGSTAAAATFLVPSSTTPPRLLAAGEGGWRLVPVPAPLNFPLGADRGRAGRGPTR